MWRGCAASGALVWDGLASKDRSKHVNHDFLVPFSSAPGLRRCRLRGTPMCSEPCFQLDGLRSCRCLWLPPPASTEWGVALTSAEDLLVFLSRAGQKLRGLHTFSDAAAAFFPPCIPLDVVWSDAHFCAEPSGLLGVTVCSCRAYRFRAGCMQQFTRSSFDKNMLVL